MTSAEQSCREFVEKKSANAELWARIALNRFFLFGCMRRIGSKQGSRRRKDTQHSDAWDSRNIIIERACEVHGRTRAV
jgi:hypothetical protein